MMVSIIINTAILMVTGAMIDISTVIIAFHGTLMLIKIKTAA